MGIDRLSLLVVERIAELLHQPRLSSDQSSIYLTSSLPSLGMSLVVARLWVFVAYGSGAWWRSIPRIHVSIWRVYPCLLNVAWKNLHWKPFVHVVRVAGEFESSKNFDDQDSVSRNEADDFRWDLNVFLSLEMQLVTVLLCFGELSESR